MIEVRDTVEVKIQNDPKMVDAFMDKMREMKTYNLIGSVGNGHLHFSFPITDKPWIMEFFDEV